MWGIRVKMALITSVSIQNKGGGKYIYAYIPTEVAQKLGINDNNKYLMWNTYGSRVEIQSFPLQEAKKLIILQQKSLQKTALKVL